MFVGQDRQHLRWHNWRTPRAVAIGDIPTAWLGDLVEFLLQGERIERAVVIIKPHRDHVWVAPLQRVHTNRDLIDDVQLARVTMTALAALVEVGHIVAPDRCGPGQHWCPIGLLGTDRRGPNC